MRPIVHIVPHTHWDREWYHPAARFQVRLAHVVDAAMDLLEHGRLPVFLLDGQGVVLDDYLLLRPEARARLRSHLAAGRLECGPWYVLADNFLVSGEALVRNLQEGARAVGRYGGKPMPVGYAPDTFGHPAILPTLFAGFGIHNAVTWRGFGGERGQEKDLYRWIGPDGAEAVMIHLPPQGYENGANLPTGRVEEWANTRGGSRRDPVKDRWYRLRSVLERRARSPYWLVLNGADHHAPQDDLADALDAIASIEKDVELRVGPLAAGVADIEAWAKDHAREVPALVGELRHGRRSQWVLQGTHSARMYLKQANAKCQRLLERIAEPLVALAGLPGIANRESRIGGPQSDLQAAWRTLLENHPHDSICGTSHDAVHREMVTRFERCEEMGGEVVREALHAVIGHDASAARLRGREKWHPGLVVFNPVPRARGGVLIADVAIFTSDVKVGQQGTTSKPEGRPTGGVEIRDLSGKALPVQELSRREGYDLVESSRYYPDCDAVEWRTIAINLDELPPLGVTTLKVDERARASSAPTVPVSVDVSEWGLVNEHLWLRVESDGTIAMADRNTGRSVHGCAAIEVMEDEGDSYTGSPRGANLAGEPDDVAVRVLHAGPLVAELEVVRRWGALGLELTTCLRLLAGERHAELSFHFVNTHPARRIRAAFPLGRALATVVADGPFGPVERSPWPVRRHPRDLEAPDPSAPMQRYVSIAGVKDALTVFADGLPQYEARKDGSLFVTLLRSFTQLSRRDLPERPGHAGWPTPTPDAACLGPASARVAFMLHAADALDQRDGIEEAADAFLLPARGFMRRELLGRPEAVAGPELKGEGLVFSAMKPAESGEGVILRCYNDRDETVRGAWGVGRGISRASQCRLDETVIRALGVAKGVVAFEAGPREIVTILVR